MRAATFLFAILAIAAIVGANLAISQDASLTSIDVRVLGSDDTAITSLKAEDFSIYEDGQRREIRGFESVQTPYSILLLVDRGPSMEEDWTFLEPAIARFLAALRPQDRVAIAGFDDKPEMLLDWRNTGEGRQVAVDLRPNRQQGGMAGGGATMRPTEKGSEVVPGSEFSFSVRPVQKDFFGALAWAEKQMTLVHARRGVIVFSDGEQLNPPMKPRPGSPFAIVNSEEDREFQRILQAVTHGEVPFYFLTMGTDLNPRHGFSFSAGLIDRMQIRSRVQQLGNVSRGNSAFPAKPDDVAPLYEQIARELGETYTLTFASSRTRANENGSGVEVRVRGDNLHVRQFLSIH